MKKIIALIVLALTLVGCASTGFKATPAKEVSEKLVNLEDVIVVFGQSTCAACTEYKVVLEELMKNYPDLPLVYVETDKDNRSDVAALVEAYLPNATVTPITYFFIDGTLVGQETGAFRYSQLKGFLTDKGFISE